MCRLCVNEWMNRRKRVFGKPTDDRSERAVADFCSAASFFAFRRGHSRDPHESSIQSIRTMSQCLSVDCHLSRKRFSFARDASPWKIAGPYGVFAADSREARCWNLQNGRCKMHSVFTESVNELLSWQHDEKFDNAAILGANKFDFYKLKRSKVERVI